MPEEIALRIRIVDAGAENTIKKIRDNLKVLKKELETTEIKSDAFKDLDKKIKETEAELKALTNTGKKAAEQLSKPIPAKGSYKDIQAQLAETRKQLQLLSDDELKGEFGSKLKQQSIELEAEFKRLRGEITNTAKKAADPIPEGSYKDLQKRLADTRGQLQLLNKEALQSDFGKNLKKEADDIEKALIELQDEMGDTERKANKLGALVGRVFGKNVGLAVNTATKSLGGFGKSIQAFAVGAAAFVAIAAAAVAAGAAVVNFSNEYTDASDTVQKYSKANGEALDKQTQEVLSTSKAFDVSAEQISQAAEQLALQSGTSFNDALARIQKGLVSGQKDNEEYLKGIVDLPSKFKDASDSLSEFSKRKQADLDANRELAKAQSDLVKKFAPLKEQFSQFASVVLPLLIKGLGYFVDIWVGYINVVKATANAIYEAGQAVTDFVGITSEAQRQAAANENAFLKEREALQQSFSSKLTKIYGKDFVDQLTTEQSLAFEFAFVNAQNAALSAGKDTATAFDEGFTAGIQNLSAAGADLTTLAQKEAAAANQQLTEEAKKAAEERAKERSKERKEFAKERADAIKEDVKREAEYYTILLSLERELVNTRAELLKDDFAKQKEQSRLAFEQATQDRAAAKATEVKNLEQEQAEFAKKVGERDKLTLERAQRTRELISDINAKYAEIDTAKAQQQANEQEQIEAEKNEFILQNKKELAEKALAQTQNINARIAEQEALDNENFLLLLQKGGLSERNLSVQQAQLKYNELKKQQERFNQEAAQIALTGLDSDKELSQERLTEKKRIDNAILAAELELNDKKKAARKADADDEAEFQKKRKEDWLSTFEAIAGFAQQGLDILTQAQTQIDDADQKRLDKESERSNKRIESLKQELNGASALRTEYLNQQIEEETQAQQKIEAEKEALEAERRKRAKQSALIEAGINVALAITRAFATQGIIAGIAVSIAGAAQIAAIAAKEFADGGLVKAGDTNIYDLSSGQGKLKGKVKQNAPATQRGDKVLAYLNEDEAVINKTQQLKIGYNTLARAGVPGFAGGGVVGARPVSMKAPRVPTSQPAPAQNAQVVDMEALAQIINSTIDAKTKNLSVNLSLNDLNAFSKDVADVKKARVLK
jgi:hypothetical protein